MNSVLCRCGLVVVMMLWPSFCDSFQITIPATSDLTTTQTTRKSDVIMGAVARTSTRVQSSSQDRSDECSDDASSPSSSSSLPAEHTVTLHYEDSSCDILARTDETILSALERNQPYLESLGLPNSMIPSDCRRGNCLTCTGTHASASSQLASVSAVVCDGDGLSPHISRTIREKGYILTCSTRVVGEGLQLNLGQNHRVWKDIYQDRLVEEPTQTEKWAAMARAKRQSDERNQVQWKKQTGELLSSAEGPENDGEC